VRSIPERLTIITINPAESAVGQSTDLAFYLVLFAVSTVVAVPLEELFFRGIVRPHLEERFHAAVAIAVASLLFVVVHTSVTVGSGGEAIAFGMFFAFGVVLGTGYYLTENLFVPLIGHVTFNGIQILLRALDVAA
jgi:membrane protease YdiL (CAAX protease family)